MIHEYELQGLLSKWREAPLTKSVSDCINDVEQLINKDYQEEAAAMALLPSEDIEKYLYEKDADAYLSSMEAHEIWY